VISRTPLRPATRLRRSGLPAARDEDEADRRTVVVGATAGRPDLQEMAEFFHRVKSELPLHRPLIEDVLRKAPCRESSSASATSGTSVRASSTGTVPAMRTG
jgi:hypothetical protein